MKRLFAVILVAAFGGESFGSGCVLGQEQQRKMLYNPRVPIVERLLPGDKEVWVYRQVLSPPLTPLSNDAQTYEQELQSLRLGDIIALIRVASVQGELVEKGTWIRTNVVADIEQLAHNRVDKPLRNSVEFTLYGGNTRIRDVDVTAGSFPRLIQGERYLVFIGTRPRIALSGLPFHVNAAGVLEHIKMNTGVEASFQTNLIGRNISEVLRALSGR